LVFVQPLLRNKLLDPALLGLYYGRQGENAPDTHKKTGPPPALPTADTHAWRRVDLWTAHSRDQRPERGRAMAVGACGRGALAEQDEADSGLGLGCRYRIVHCVCNLLSRAQNGWTRLCLRG
jgi:hypothetical protein